MLISSRGRYALRVMIDLAEHGIGGGYIPMKDVAARQDLSLKYMEQIMPLLTKGKLVEGVAGKGGGYRLAKPPEDCTVWEVLRLTEGDLAPTTCLEDGFKSCEHAGECRTLPLWTEFYALVSSFFDKKSIADLMKTPAPDLYEI